MVNMDDYYKELLDSIDARLKIEDINEPEMKGYEKQFRTNNFFASKFSNRVNIHVSLIRYIVNILSNFHHRLQGKIAKKPVNALFIHNDDNDIINKIHDNASNINNCITRIIQDIETNGHDEKLFYMPIDQFQKINILLDRLTMFDNTFKNNGLVDCLFVNTPEIMAGFTNNIIIYLLNLMIFEDDPQYSAIFTPILNNVIVYIKNTEMTNNITDKNIKIIMDKHRADENQTRLKRFNKKDDEEKGLHNIYRKYNLGNQLRDEKEIVVDDTEVAFLSVDADEHSPIIQNEAGLDDFDAEQEQQNVMEIDMIALSDNLLEDDMEDREEYE